MIWGDPLLDVFMRIMNWHMCFKTSEEADGIAKDAGWNLEDSFNDFIGYNRMTIARY